MSHPFEVGGAERYPVGLNNTLVVEAYQRQAYVLDAQIAAIIRSGAPQEIVVEDPEQKLLLSAAEHANLWGLFPSAARERAVPADIHGESTLWLSKVAGGRQEYSPDSSLAVSPDAFVFGQTSFENTWLPKGRSAHVSLFQIPEALDADQSVQRIAEARAVVHAHAHRIIAPDLLDADAKLITTHGAHRDTVGFLIDFFETASKYPAISHLASAYRKGFYADSQVLSKAISEELAESITAYLLCSTVDPQTATSQPEVNFTPFAGREDVRILVHDYLHAQRVEQAS